MFPKVKLYFLSATLTFESDDTSLSQVILAFGNISTKSVKDDTESNESFVFADDDRDGIEIVSKEESINDIVSKEESSNVEWLREGKSSTEQYSSLEIM